MLVYQKTLFDRFLLHIGILSLENFEKTLLKVFCIAIMARKSMKDS